MASIKTNKIKNILNIFLGLCVHDNCSGIDLVHGSPCGSDTNRFKKKKLTFN